MDVVLVSLQVAMPNELRVQKLLAFIKFVPELHQSLQEVFFPSQGTQAYQEVGLLLSMLHQFVEQFLPSLELESGEGFRREH